jgi:hypothetical protein
VLQTILILIAPVNIMTACDATVALALTRFTLAAEALAVSMTHQLFRSRGQSMTHLLAVEDTIAPTAVNG